MLTPKQLAVVRLVNEHTLTPKCYECVHAIESYYHCTRCEIDNKWRDSFAIRSDCMNWKTTAPILPEN